MLRQAFANQMSNRPIDKTIKLPSKSTLKKNKTTVSTLISSAELDESSKFINEPLSGTPPDKYFMHNLLLRMEKV